MFKKKISLFAENQEKVNRKNPSILDYKKFDITDLLERKIVKPNKLLLNNVIKNKIILITGAGGSIGSSIASEVIKYQPKKVILNDVSEYSLFKLKKLIYKTNSKKLSLSLGSVLDKKYLENIIKENKVNIIFHSAAYKHVDIVENNYLMGVKNNIVGTYNVCDAALNCKVLKTVLISTDKAVNPINYMGLSKKIAEKIVIYFSNKSKNLKHINFCSVRFGNVLGSSGSVLEIFNKQLKQNQSLTVTSKKATRYFMTINEAALLTIQAAGLSKGGEIFFLDMGKPKNIYKLAKKVINIYKMNINQNYSKKIKIIGLKKGEKVHERLIEEKIYYETIHPKIFKSADTNKKFSSFMLLRLIEHLNNNNKDQFLKLVRLFFRI